jgi:hypothetical protein
MSRIFIPHEPLRRDPESGEMVRKIDLSPAAAFGELVFLLPPGEPPRDPVPTIEILRAKLAGFQSNDYLLPVGSPLLIAWAAAIAARAAGGRLRLLQWRFGAYAAVEAILWDEPYDAPACSACGPQCTACAGTGWLKIGGQWTECGVCFNEGEQPAPIEEKESTP